MKKEKTEMIEYTLKNNDFRLSKPLFDTFFGPYLSMILTDIQENRAVYLYNASNVSDVSGIVGAL
jgi:hypothetical protein